MMDPEGVFAGTDRGGESRADQIATGVPVVRGKYGWAKEPIGRLTSSECVFGAPKASDGPVIGRSTRPVPRDHMFNADLTDGYCNLRLSPQDGVELEFFVGTQIYLHLTLKCGP